MIINKNTDKKIKDKKKDIIEKIFNDLTEEDYGKTADFHLHTKASDGKLSAEELLKQAKAD